MRIVFMGTSEFAVPVLHELINNKTHITGVVTKPDRPRGRGNKVSSTPVKQVALEKNIPIIETARIRSAESIARVKEWDPELIIVVSFGEIIPPELLDYPVKGCINLHPSMLPLFRGPAPIQRVLMSGETVTGVTTMYLDEGLDTGDIIMQRQILIPDACNYGELEQILARNGADLMLQTIKSIENSQAVRKRQGQDFTYAPLITAADERIKWTSPAVEINNLIRALSPYPGAYASFKQNRFKIFRAKIMDDMLPGQPGEIRELTEQGMIILTGLGSLEVLEVQREGKKRMPCKSFLQGFQLKPGDILDI